jgi:hypothetical protein
MNHHLLLGKWWISAVEDPPRGGRSRVGDGEAEWDFSRPHRALGMSNSRRWLIVNAAQPRAPAGVLAGYRASMRS